MSHKEMTAHIRKRLKVENIPARCSLYTACGIKYVKVSMDKELFFGSREWTSEQARMIAHIADCNGLNDARRSKIDPALNAMLTKSHQFDFEYWAQ